MARINEHANLRGLARDVILGAFRDLLFGTALEQVFALDFLASSDFQFWKDIGNMDTRVSEVLKNPERTRGLLKEYKKGNAMKPYTSNMISTKVAVKAGAKPRKNIAPKNTTPATKKSSGWVTSLNDKTKVTTKGK